MKNFKNRIITISGDPASGKSTLVRELKRLYEAEGLEVEIISTGAKFREISLKEYMKMFPDAINPSQEEIQNNPAFVEKLKEIDLKIDGIIADTGREINSRPQPGKVFIFDSRTACKFVDSFPVMITASSKTAGMRAFNDPERKPEERGASPEEAIKDTESRREAEIKRYKELYGIHIKDPNNFKLIIETDEVNLNEMAYVAQIIKMCEECEAKGETYAKRWASPKTFYPTQEIRKTDDSYVWENMDSTDREYPPYIRTIDLQRMYPEMQITYKTQQIGNWKRIGYKISELAQKITEEGFDPNAPVDATTIGKNTYKLLGEGHHRVFGSINAGIPLVPYIITEHTDIETVPRFMLRYIHDHEGILQPDGTTFYYSEYPEEEGEKSISNHDLQDDDAR